MKLYTEEQVKEMINDVGGGFVWYYDIIKKHTPIELPSWISVKDSLPKPLQTVWISNGKGWTTLGCISEAEEGDDGRFYWHWCETNGIIYQENGEIVSECEGNDLDVLFWHELPKPILNANEQ